MLAHFAEGGRNFRWEFFDAVRAGNVGYASYRFSFNSLRPEAKGARVLFDGIGRFDLEGDRIRRYSEVFDRGMALAQQEFEPERLRKIGLKYARRAEGPAGVEGASVRRDAAHRGCQHGRPSAAPRPRRDLGSRHHAGPAPASASLLRPTAVSVRDPLMLRGLGSRLRGNDVLR